MAKLLIIRGVPGSGKSTMAEKLCLEGVYDSFLEADMFFTEDNGHYDFDPTKLPQAHEWCFSSVCRGLKEGWNVIVSNTFSRLWEMEKYISFCKENNIPFEVVEATGNYQNIHGVPTHVVHKMKSRWEKYP